MATRYAFMLRPISSFHVPPDVSIVESDGTPTTATVRIPSDGSAYGKVKTIETRVLHGTATLSRELTDSEQRHFDVYPVVEA